MFMLKFMRKHATSWFIKIVIGAIVVVFILYFGGQRQERRKLIVATVGDNSITRGDFDRTYRNALESYRKIFGQQLTPELLKKLDIKQQVLDQLINVAVMQQGAEDMGLGVSDEEVRGAILHNPAFQRGGGFDRYLYEEFLRTAGLDPDKFLALLRGDLLSQRIAEIIGDTAAILSEDEVKDLYVLANGKINLSFVKVSPLSFTGQVTITPEKLTQYYAEHKEEYHAPAQAKVIYLRFSPDAYLKEVDVSPQEVQKYYDMNREQYSKPTKVRVGHILIKVSPDAAPDVVQKARLKAEKVLAEARGGANFAALARQYSNDPSASKGGDLGYFSRDEMDPSFGKVIFSIRKGEISSVVQSNVGFHIFKAEDVQRGNTRTLNEVKKEIISHLMNEKAEDRAAMHAEDAAYQAKKMGGLKPYADEARLQVREAGPFKAGEPESKGKLPSVAFSLEKGDISAAFQDDKDYVVLQVVDKIPPQVLPLDKVKVRVTQALTASLAQGLAQGLARDLLSAWSKGQGFQDLLRRYGLRVDETGFFKRSESSAPRLGPLGAFAAKIATLTQEGPWPDDIAELNNAFVVIKLQGVEGVGEKEYAKENAAFRTQLESYTGKAFVQGWLAEMKKKVKIEINQELLGEFR
jgi:peptidyl-prolyl cis-trans isomerase D